MKEVPLSNCEKTFIIHAIKQNKRLDGRTYNEFRKLKINYGSDWGGVLVSLGDTKVLAQVSSEIGEPKATRPNEGILYINVELGSIAAPNCDTNRMNELTIQICRTLERTFKDSRCVDLESLCITSEERVWILRVDINVLNYAGNLIDCCSVATLCALAHYRRPDVSFLDDDDDVIIHTADEKELIPMVIHHWPVCITYAIYDSGRIALADPTILEELTCESQMIFGVNSYGELCCLNLNGSALTSTTLLLQCSKRAANSAKNIVETIKKGLEDDNQLREGGKKVGFADSILQHHVTVVHEDRLLLKLRNFTFDNDNQDLPTKLSESQEDILMQSDDDNEPKCISDQSNRKNELTSSAWLPPSRSSDSESSMNKMSDDSDNSGSDDSDTDVEKIVEEALLSIKSMHKQEAITKQTEDFLQDDSSEEEETIIL